MPARERSLRMAVWLCPGLLVLGLCTAGSVRAQDLEDTRKLFRAGDYEGCIQTCEKGAARYGRDEEWPLLQVQSLLAVGRYETAEGVISNALSRMGTSIRLQWAGIETAQFTGQPDVARRRFREINELFRSRSWAYREAADIVTLGKLALRLGADPKSILEKLYGAAQKADPNYRESYLASGDLALSKHDYALAAKSFTEALKKFPDDPDLLHGLAQAYEPNARGRMLELLKTALEKNKNHVPSLLLLVDHALDAEEYGEADKLLERALKVNPWQPEAWAYRAVLANLRTDPAGETEARAKALRFWPTNPDVDHLIGAKLAQKYRFVEGAAYQRQALEFDADFLPAQIELAQDLLRLGDAEGWALAEEVHKQDGYDVTAYNLATLRTTMQKYQTLTNADFVLRMAANEAALYGDRALALLQRAKSNLVRKYGIELEKPTYVEIFPEQKDFAVRTFGMPHNPGFLGVCFGRVVTANSPAAQGGNPANWEAVLWHEFCHVVTLQMTKNKMPRWLSEGISVYEELQQNPAWGQRMNPRYRAMVLGEDLKPVSELSSAFMTPKSDLHVQFAYYQSALVVEYLVGKFGFDKLKAILAELARGTDINEAIAKHTAPMKQIEKEFAAFAKGRAEALGPGLDWEKPTAAPSLRQRLGLRAESQRNAIFTTNAPTPPARTPSLPHPTNDLHLASNSAPAKPVAPTPPVEVAVKSSGKVNYWKLMDEAAELVSRKQWQAAKTPLKSLIELYPEQTGANSAYALLASVHRGLDEPAEERAALEKWAAQDADALEAYNRLMELAEATKDWKTVAQNAERSLAVNPLLPQPYRYLSRASEELGDAGAAVRAYEKQLLLDPPDPAEVHFRLAKLLHNTNAPAAKRHVLQALEEAPRFRAAHQLLLELAQANSSPTNSAIEISPK